ncbi:MAG: hypothetical protein HY851_03780, partial [candidate division Zixibacteria bacterium]|nr:hypothetical protein [candidate division Zixibacteria bacterium]
YFLVENRQRTGFDTWLPGCGEAIWHIDERSSENYDDAHRLVDLEEMDGTENNSAGDLWLNKSFNDSSTPHSWSNAGYPTGVAVSVVSTVCGASLTSNFTVGQTPASRAWYVSMTGSDEAGDGTASLPFRSIQYAVDASRAGENVIVGSGNYYERVYVNAGITLQGSGMDSCYIDADGTKCGVVVGNGRNFRMSGFTVRSIGGTPNTGIEIGQDCSGVILSDNRIMGVPIGIVMSSGDSLNLITRNMIVSAPQASGILFSAGARCKIVGNTFYGGSTAIDCRDGDILVDGNIIARFTTGVYHDVGLCAVQYNDVWQTTQPYISSSGAFAPSPGTGEISADPLFVDSSVLDFNLGCGSPCIDAGNPDASLDPDGTRIDMGALRFDWGDSTNLKPNQVQGVAASDNECWAVTVTWTDIKKEWGYRIFRDGEEINSVGMNVVKYVDTKTKAATRHAYSVCAFNRCVAGAVSMSDTGWKAPDLVTGVSASDGWCNAVVVNWTDLDRDEGYRIYRNDSLIGYVFMNVTTFYDTAGELGARYAYSVRAARDCGLGPASVTDTGWKGTLTPQVTGVTASRGDCYGNIIVRWSRAQSDLYYRILVDSQAIDSVATGVTQWTYKAPQCSRWYKMAVQVVTPCGAGQVSVPDSGYTECNPPSAPYLSVSSASCSSAIALAWNGGFAATYSVYRNSNLYRTLGPGFTSFVDSPVVCGISYSYLIRVSSACGWNNSNTVTAQAPCFPFQAWGVQAADNGSSVIKVTWGRLLKGEQYRVYRDNLLVSPDMANTDTVFIDSCLEGCYDYSVESFTPCASVRSAKDRGCRSAKTLVRIDSVGGKYSDTQVLAGDTVRFNVTFINRFPYYRFNLTNGWMIYSKPSFGSSIRGSGTAGWVSSPPPAGRPYGYRITDSPNRGPQVDTTGLLRKSDFGGTFSVHCFGCDGFGIDTVVLTAEANNQNQAAFYGRDSGIGMVIWVVTSVADSGQVICIDSVSRRSSASTWLWTPFYTAGATNELPSWSGEKCFELRPRSLCCKGRAGNVDCDPGDGTDISDLSRLIDNLFISFTPLCCPTEANVDGQPGIDISDLSALVDYLFITFTPTAGCQ